MAFLDRPSAVSDSTLAYLQRSQGLTPLVNPLDTRISRTTSRIPILPSPGQLPELWPPCWEEYEKEQPPIIPGIDDLLRRKPRPPPYKESSGFISMIASFFKFVVGAQPTVYSATESDKEPSPDRTDCDIGPSSRPPDDTSIARHVVPGSRRPDPSGSANLALIILPPIFEVHLGLEAEVERQIREIQEKEKARPPSLGS